MKANVRCSRRERLLKLALRARSLLDALAAERGRSPDDTELSEGRDVLITRDRARSIAEQFLRDRSPGPGWEGIGDVLSPEEVEGALPPALQAFIPFDARWRRCWTIRVRGAAGAQILISRETGQIEFAGTVQGGPRAHAG